ncbi:MAG TPA: Ni/Fe hydrogenase subunit alpha [Thermoplasmatales archaeon]|nr:Ni/Fe hydrogenase subunit alpha [Thermoplasmatales archaeon]
MEKSIEIHHVTRVEGHGNIVVKISDGKVKEVEWQVSEAPRFFESIVKGQHYSDIPKIASRICGICSIGHTIASIKAVEDAFSVDITEQTLILRKLALHAENMQSHILHIGFLALPDLFGEGSVIGLVKSGHKDLVNKVLSIHKLANEFSDLICGRTTHPISMVVGGFTSIPSKKSLLNMRDRIEREMNTVIKLADEINKKKDNFPDFSRETEYIALSTEDEYAFYDGLITSTDTGVCREDYTKIIEEYVVPQSTAKYTKHARDSYMVGALARFNINYSLLKPLAKDIAKTLDIKPICYNPFMNTLAQLVEIAHNMEESIDLIDLVVDDLKEESIPEIKIKACRGVGMAEVPRGLLIHDYTFNEKGRCERANMIIPTNQNHANIQKDMESFLPTIADKPSSHIELAMEMLVRAYDPCISCSTHTLKVKVEKK